MAAVAASQYAPAPRQQLVALLQQGMTGTELRPHLSRDKWREAERIVAACRELSIEILPVSSARYPYRLHEIQAPPAALYVRSAAGPWNPPDAMLAVVGTRAASVEICGFATQVSMELAVAGFSIVSGLALGIDGAAHRGALLVGGAARDESEAGATIAVLAHGLDQIYPPSHEPLAEQILASGGALVSEYPPGTQALKHHFLARNRVIAGMSRGVVVIQAGARSGSLVTARFGADFGRDVFVYQVGEVDERHSGGSQMIEDGAIPFSDARRILAEYGLMPASPHPEAADGGRELEVEAFLREHRLTEVDLLKLELEEKVERLPGNRLRLKARIREGQ